MDELEKLRSEIDEYDKQIACLFEKRMYCAYKIGEYKKENNISVCDKNREAFIKNRNIAYVSDDIKTYYGKLLETMFKLSKRFQGDNGVVTKRGAICNISDYIDIKNRKTLIITDNGVPAEYSECVKNQCDFPYLFVLKQGEESKNYESIISVVEYMLENNFNRGDCVISVGGGVVSDIAGFAASVYMRGVDFYCIPTTLLACVDASIGGKNGIDFNGIKNIIGSFYMPSKVIIDTDLLKTLSKRQIACGMAEIIKIAVICDKELFEYLEKNDFCANEDYIISRCAKNKENIVFGDEKESGKRIILNFGHTIGHAVEAYENGRLLHGECVALGMLPMVTEIIGNRLISVYKKYGLPFEYACDTEEIYKIIIHDKKSAGNYIRVIKSDEIGKCHIEEADFGKIKEYIDFFKG